jgi:quinolinate synthase
MQISPIKFERYQASNDEDLKARIVAAKAKLGKKLVILGHHYQQEGVYRHADFTGDSLKLSRFACQD